MNNSHSIYSISPMALSQRKSHNLWLSAVILLSLPKPLPEEIHSRLSSKECLIQRHFTNTHKGLRRNASARVLHQIGGEIPFCLRQSEPRLIAQANINTRYTRQKTA
ncbi:hypothetical protein M9H77_11675 [Catharanthus roseus]|uniref:Uncharacterized protein n=1 Tax=Catharanthus roseus TaxID=4058 RepID=A0ACC0BF74_CATRO|nr:hypothetical protein M9H77_11675 [Catharanthus roseus]